MEQTEETMKFHIRTIQVFLVVATGPIWALTAGANAGCMLPIVCVWSVLVFIPFGLMMGIAMGSESSESFMEKLVALLGAIAIVGYMFALFLTFVTIGIQQRPFEL